MMCFTFCGHGIDPRRILGRLFIWLIHVGEDECTEI